MPIPENSSDTQKVKRATLSEVQFHVVWTEFALQPGYKNPEHKKIFQATLESLKKKKLII